MRPPSGSEPFERFNLPALGVDGEDGAAIHHLAVDDDGAGAAGAAVADALGCREIQAMAESIAEGGAWLDFGVIWFAVDVEGDGHFAGAYNVRGGRCLRVCFENARCQGATRDAHSREESAAGNTTLPLLA